MPSKKNRKHEQKDDQFLQKQKKLQQTLKKVKNLQKNLQQDNEESLGMLNSKKKQVFDYDFSTQKALLEHQQKQEKIFKQKQQRQKQEKKLTVQQQIQFKKKLQKQRREKQRKQRKKQEKKAERLKEVEEEKIKQLKQKEEKEKQAQQVKSKLNKPQASGKCIPIFFVLFIVILCGLQYQREIYTRLSKFKLQGQQNFYETFQIDSGATDRQLKQKYKRLVLKYHPDKNPNCIECEQKFNNIIKAWQVLGSPQKRKHYDMNSGFVTQIKSHSITLTPQIYETLQTSPSLWIIQVYDSTEKYCHYFAQFWQDIIRQYGQYIKFGRIDVWTQSDMTSYLPYRFQVFPSIYYVHKGEIGLCDFDFQQPDSSVRRCIEARYKENIVKQINSIQEVDITMKPAIVFNQKIKLGFRFKIINKKYEADFNFYSLSSDKGTDVKNGEQIISINKNGQRNSFKLSQKDPEYYQKYQKFLQSLIVQKISICEFITRCQNQECFVLTNSQVNLNNLTLPKQNPLQSRPLFSIQEEKQFFRALQNFKNKTQLHQNFDIGLYQNGHLDVGYMDEIDILNIEEGESFNELKCEPKDRSLIGKLKRLGSYIGSFLN